MSNRISPFAVHKEVAARDTERAAAAKPSPELSGREINCVVGGVNDAPIPVMYDPHTRTTFPIRQSK